MSPSRDHRGAEDEPAESSPPPRSIHDNEMLGFSVDSKSRTIVLHTLDTQWRKGERTDVLFEGVSAYDFRNDNFATILTAICEVPAVELFESHRAAFDDGRAYGWPGFWNTSEDAVRAYIEANGFSGYTVHSAMGMAGWLWAKSMRLLAVPAP